MDGWMDGLIDLLRILFAWFVLRRR